MKAVVCKAFGKPDQLVFEEWPLPPLANNEVNVRLHARGVSYTDLLKVAGQYQVKNDPPFVVGGEACGEIVELGADVEGLRVGQRVLCGGGFAEYTHQRAESVVPLPEQVDFRAGAAFRSNYMTAYYGLQRARLRPGETLLVHGAAGGVGLAAVDMAKLMGARVIATARSAERLEVVKSMGADDVVDYSDGFRDEVKALTDGRGADVIYDPVGGDVFDESVRCIAPFGRILVVGFTSGRAAQAKTNHLLVKDAEVIGYTLGGLQKHAPEWSERNLNDLIRWLSAGRISPYYSHAIPLANAIEAFDLLQARAIIGKAILV
jgi:NADPH:quinone reductase